MQQEVLPNGKVRWHRDGPVAVLTLDHPPANGYSHEYPLGRFYRNCTGAVIYEGTREIHKIMQADYLLGYRNDKPTRCELPAWRS